MIVTYLGIFYWINNNCSMTLFVSVFRNYVYSRPFMTFCTSISLFPKGLNASKFCNITLQLVLAEPPAEVNKSMHMIWSSNCIDICQSSSTTSPSPIPLVFFLWIDTGIVCLTFSDHANSLQRILPFNFIWHLIITIINALLVLFLS